LSFFFNSPATTTIYTLSLHDALPIFEEQKKFFANALGGTAMKIGTNNLEIVKFPNVLIFLRPQAPTGGSKGTTANHIGFSRLLVDRKSTRLNSSHRTISYAVFCLKKK